MGSTFTDQLGGTISLPHLPTRIISLVPSQTELLYDLGIRDEVVGITKFCVHPAVWLQTKSKIGGTKDFRFDQIDALRPDLIIGNKEENYQEGIERLRLKYPVWMSDIVTLEDAYQMIGSVGAMLDKELSAEKLIGQIRQNFHKMDTPHPRRVLYLIWKSPWMGAGKQTFVNSLLEKNGLINVLEGERYPVVTEWDIRELSPDIIILPSEPFPFREKHVLELIQIAPKARVLLADGEMFSWYGSRLVLAPAYFKTLFSWKDGTVR